MKKALCLLAIIVLSCIAFVSCQVLDKLGIGASSNAENEHKHDFKLVENKPATCTENGGNVYKCDCGDVQMRDLVEALGHTEISYKAKEPTCTERGWEAYTWCPTCGYYSTRTEIVELGHDIINHEGEDSTCIVKGWAAYDTCSRCDYTTYEELALKVHVYDNIVVTEPTTTSGGYTTYSCDCGDSYVSNYTEPSTHSIGLKYELSSDKTGYIVTGYGDCRDLDLIIPEEYNALPVIGIGYAAFDFTGVKSVKLPANLVYIDECAFEYSDIENVIFAENGNLKEIGALAFKRCLGLTSISIPDSVTVIGGAAFQYCDSLVSVEIGDGVTEIRASAFAGCVNIESVVLPVSLLSVGDDAFRDCFMSVYYKGTYAQWQQVHTEYYSDLTRSTFYYYSETKPSSTSELRYWYYSADGEIVRWYY